MYPVMILQLDAKPTSLNHTDPGLGHGALLSNAVRAAALRVIRANS